MLVKCPVGSQCALTALLLLVRIIITLSFLILGLVITTDLCHVSQAAAQCCTGKKMNYHPLSLQPTGAIRESQHLHEACRLDLQWQVENIQTWNLQIIKKLRWEQFWRDEPLKKWEQIQTFELTTSKMSSESFHNVFLDQWIVLNLRHLKHGWALTLPAPSDQLYCSPRVPFHIFFTYPISFYVIVEAASIQDKITATLQFLVSWNVFVTALATWQKCSPWCQ